MRASSRLADSRRPRFCSVLIGARPLRHNLRMAVTGGLRTARAPQFGVVLHRPPTERSNQPFYDSFLAGLEETLDLHGAGVFVQMASSRQEENETYPRWAREVLVDAVVIVDPVWDD